MKKLINQVIIVGVCVVILFVWSGCSKKDREASVVLLPDDVVTYDEQGINTYTVDRDGTLYTAAFDIIPNETYGEVEAYTTLTQFNMDNSVAASKQFSEYGNFLQIAADQGKVYFTVHKYDVGDVFCSLHCYDMQTDTDELLYDFKGFAEVKNMIVSGDRIYVLLQKLPDDHTGSVAQERNEYESKGEQIICYSLTDQKAYELGISNPINMTLGDAGNLIVNSYIESKGYCLLRYNQEKDTASVIASDTKGKFDSFAVCNQETSVIYSYSVNTRGLVLSDMTAIEEEAELYLDVSGMESSIYYANGFIYCISKSGKPIRFPLDKVQKTNQCIRYISPGYQLSAPYGCGYHMERKELAEDMFYLKVLAMDPDYDLCLIDSGNSNSYNIKKNGVFYPLNDVPVVKEYLEECFAYVKDAATDEDGNVWMLPIAVDIPTYLVNETCIKSKLPSFHNDMTYEEFFAAMKEMDAGKEELAFYNSMTLYLSFFHQISASESGIASQAQKNVLTLFQKNHTLLPEYLSTSLDLNKEFLFSYGKEQAIYETRLSGIKDQEALRFYSLPKIHPEDKNTGTCLFLAVNPNSDRINETLSYIQDWIAYTMNQKKRPFYMKQEFQDSASQSLYQIYEQGEIAFQYRDDLYWDQSEEMLNENIDIDAYLKDMNRKVEMYLKE